MGIVYLKCNMHTWNQIYSFACDSALLGHILNRKALTVLKINLFTESHFVKKMRIALIVKWCVGHKCLLEVSVEQIALIKGKWDLFLYEPNALYSTSCSPVPGNPSHDHLLSLIKNITAVQWIFFCSYGTFID